MLCRWRRRKRALVLVGAGASLEFGAPSTTDLTIVIERSVYTNKWMQKLGGDRAYKDIHKTLAASRKGGISTVNFEHIYHCAHELLFTFPPDPGTANEYRPIFQPFICRHIQTDERALKELVRYMAKVIFEELSKVCKKPKTNLGPLKSFVRRLRRDQITRIYTTNYDDFLWQAAPDLYTGFSSKPSCHAKRFDRREFWRATDTDCLFHMHGSVHLASPPPRPLNTALNTDLGDLHWFDKRADALAHSSSRASGEKQMDGSIIVRTPIITGLDKLSRLQKQPLAHYYASMARDAMMADIIYVIGYSLGDLHLNTWLGEARRLKPKPTLIFIDKWPNRFLCHIYDESDRKISDMAHVLHMRDDCYDGVDECANGWTLDTDRNCAIWDDGFLAFLNAPAELENVLTRLGRQHSRR